MAPESHQIFGHYCMKHCREDFLKMAQSGHTGGEPCQSRRYSWGFESISIGQSVWEELMKIQNLDLK